MKKLLYLQLTLLVSIYSYSQKKPKEVHITDIWGTAIQSTTESFFSCKQRAINEAKTNALRKAGISENVTSYSVFFKSEVDGKYSDIFKTDILNDMKGYVIVNTENELKKELDDFGNLVIKINLDVTVLKYANERDRTFDAWVKGLNQKGFLSTDPVTFSIKPSQDMYIRIFDLVDQKVYPLYPNEFEPNSIFLKEQEIDFPTSSELKYLFEFEGERESHNFIILLLKEDIPYTSTSVESKDLLNWIFKIPPHQRLVKTYSFDVYKKS